QMEQEPADQSSRREEEDKDDSDAGKVEERQHAHRHCGTNHDVESGAPRRLFEHLQRHEPRHGSLLAEKSNASSVITALTCTNVPKPDVRLRTATPLGRLCIVGQPSRLLHSVGGLGVGVSVILVEAVAGDQRHRGAMASRQGILGSVSSRFRQQWSTSELEQEQQMAQSVAEQIVSQLSAAGVSRIYGIVGDSLNPIVDAVRRTGGSASGGIDWVHVRHEEAAAFAASAEAQVTGRLAVCAGSCGPGN